MGKIIDLDKVPSAVNRQCIIEAVHQQGVISVTATILEKIYSVCCC